MQKSKSVISGIMITAGSAIGAGMFSLPIVSSGMWFTLSLFMLIIVWYLSYLSSLVLLEVNLQYPRGSSYDTFVKDILGKRWNIFSGLGVAFLLYILLYAYFSAFGNIVSHTISWQTPDGSQWTNGVMSLIFGGILAAIVWRSTTLVGRISTILVTGMAITFVISMSGLSLQTETSKLFNIGSKESDYFSYIWAALPYFLTSFGFSSIVPSLYKYYGNEPGKIRKSLLFGSLLSLIVYSLFIFVSFGLISRPDFVTINEAGGNIGQLVSAMTQNSNEASINSTLTVFSNFAIISSFLGVGLCLFDYIADMFHFADDNKGRFYSACFAFIPPGIASFFFPNGFIAAIGFAALAVVFAYFILPIVMVWKTRRKKIPTEYKLWGGNILLFLVLAASIIIGVSHILAMLDYLPTY